MRYRLVSKVRLSDAWSPPSQQGTSFTQTLGHRRVSKIRHSHTTSPQSEQGTSHIHCVTAESTKVRHTFTDLFHKESFGAVSSPRRQVTSLIYALCHYSSTRYVTIVTASPSHQQGVSLVYWVTISLAKYVTLPLTESPPLQ